MREWVVYSKNGDEERCRLKKLEYSGTFMNERAVTATFESEHEIGFEIFDYIEYRGERFELEAEPTVKKLSSVQYEYELRFVSYKYELERCEMRDLVLNDNKAVYPTPLSFSFTGNVRYLTERIQANLDELYGEGVWSIEVAEGTESEEKNITIAQQNCWNALSMVNTTYGLNFQIKGRRITVGGEQSVVDYTFEYGKGKGLYEIERVADTNTAVITKLRAFGSDRNLDYSYPKKPEWADSVLGNTFVFSPLRLMLPSFKQDGKTDYILAEESVIEEYGIREASVIYDDIYPSITGATNSKGEAIDEIQAVGPIANEDASTFVVYLKDLGFDLEEHLTTVDAQISMKSGAMQGYTFNIANDGIERLANGSYKITLGRITTDASDTGNYNIPNKDWNMKAGDKFVLLGILMPQEYIREAEERLLARAKEYLEEYGKTNFSYNIGMHDKFLMEHGSVYDDLIEGAKLDVYDADLGISERVTIQSLTITEDMEENILPQVKVTLNNKPSASTLDRIQGQIKELSDSTTGNFSSQSELLQQYRKKLDKPFFDRVFVAMDANGNEIASNDLFTPIAYVKVKSHMASAGGFTAYATDDVEIPTIAEELPYDKSTIWYNPETEKIEVIGGTGGGGGEALTKDEIIEMGFNLASEDVGIGIEESSEEYATKGYVDKAISNIGGVGGGEPLTIKDSTGLEEVVYDGKEAKELTLTKGMVGLDNVENIPDSDRYVGYARGLKNSKGTVFASTILVGSDPTNKFGRSGEETWIDGKEIYFHIGQYGYAQPYLSIREDGSVRVIQNLSVGKSTAPEATLDVEGDARITEKLTVKELDVDSFKVNKTIGIGNVSLTEDEEGNLEVNTNVKVQGEVSSESVDVGGIKLTKLEDGVLKLDGHLVVTEGLTTYSTDEVPVSNEVLQSLIDRISALESEVERLKNG